MSDPIEDYALIGDCETAALVGRDGSIDWLCLPALRLRRLLRRAARRRPSTAAGCSRRRDEVRAVRRRYRDDTLVLETEFETDDRGRSRSSTSCRRAAEAAGPGRALVEGVAGAVAMRMELVIRFDYGSIVPWVRRTAARHLGGRRARRAPAHRRRRRCTARTSRTVADFTVAAGRARPVRADLASVARARAAGAGRRRRGRSRETEAWWRDWSGRCTYARRRCATRWCAR